MPTAQDLFMEKIQGVQGQRTIAGQELAELRQGVTIRIMSKVAGERWRARAEIVAAVEQHGGRVTESGKAGQTTLLRRFVRWVRG